MARADPRFAPHLCLLLPLVTSLLCNALMVVDLLAFISLFLACFHIDFSFTYNRKFSVGIHAATRHKGAITQTISGVSYWHLAAGTGGKERSSYHTDNRCFQPQP